MFYALLRRFGIVLPVLEIKLDGFLNVDSHPAMVSVQSVALCIRANFRVASEPSGINRASSLVGAETLSSDSTRLRKKISTAASRRDSRI